MREEAVEFQTLLKYDEKRHLVGVRFLASEEEYNRQETAEATHQMFFCMMVKAGAGGHCMKVRREHIYCSAAAEVLGFAEAEEDVRSGKRLCQRGMYETEKVAADIAGDMPYLEHHVYGMVLMPLELCQEEPDIVISVSLPYTAMRVIQGYSYKYGYARHILFAGMGGICTELAARAYKNQDMNVSFLCSGTRYAAAWKDEEVGIAFPYKMFLEVLDGVRKTMNTFEPDEQKEEIARRARMNGLDIAVNYGENYHGSSLGVANMGVEGYRPRKRGKGERKDG